MAIFAWPVVAILSGVQCICIIIKVPEIRACVDVDLVLIGHICPIRGEDRLRNHGLNFLNLEILPIFLNAQFELHQHDSCVVVLPHQVLILWPVSQRPLALEVFHKVAEMLQKTSGPGYFARAVREVSWDGGLLQLFLEEPAYAVHLLAECGDHPGVLFGQTPHRDVFAELFEPGQVLEGVGGVPHAVIGVLKAVLQLLSHRVHPRQELHVILRKYSRNRLISPQ